MPRPKIHETMGRHSADFFEWVPTNDGRGQVRRKAGTRTAVVDVFIDLNKLNDHARRAVRNKTGRASLASNAIVFKVLKHTLITTKASNLQCDDA